MSDASRDRVLHFLRKSDQGLTLEELGKLLDVTPMAVHRQLKQLESQGLISAESIRHGRGRPRHVYQLTASAENFFPKSYSQLLLDLLRDVKWKEGPARIRRLFDSRFKKLLHLNLRPQSLAAHISEVCSRLRQNGYMAEQEQISARKFRLKLYNCPTTDVAREFPEICACEKCTLSDVLQAKVTRDRHILAGNNYCSYTIEKK